MDELTSPHRCMWPFLSRQQQKEILEGTATIERLYTPDRIDKLTIELSD